MNSFNDLTSWLSTTTSDSEGLATWLALGVAAVGGAVALRTYRRSVAIDQQSADREKRKQVSQVFSRIDCPYMKLIPGRHNSSPWDQSFDLWPLMEFRLPGGEDLEVAHSAPASLLIENASPGPIRVDGIRLRYVGVIDRTPRDESYLQPWIVVEGGEGISLAHQRSEKLPLHEERITPPWTSGSVVELPGIAAEDMIPWTPAGGSINYDLRTAQRFVLTSFVGHTADREQRERLMAVFVELVHVDVTDAFGSQWQLTGSGIEAI